VKQNDDLAIIAFVLVMGGAVCLVILTEITAPLCDPAKIRSMTPDKLEFGCLEFWINRYQAMIGTIAALLAALFAWKSATMQVDANREAAAAAQKAQADSIANAFFYELQEIKMDLDLRIKPANGFPADVAPVKLLPTGVFHALVGEIGILPGDVAVLIRLAYSQLTYLDPVYLGSAEDAQYMTRVRSQARVCEHFVNDALAALDRHGPADRTIIDRAPG